jgi:transcriptional regulator with XRE-family HTH domain
MSEKLNQAAKNALDAASASLRELAEEAGVHKITFAKWSSGAANAGPRSALKLAEVLERRALRLLEASARLRAQAEHEQKGATDE